MEQSLNHEASLLRQEKPTESRMRPGSSRLLRQRKFLMILPLIVLPFITLLFWAMGGGKINNAHTQLQQKGFNMNLPGAYLKDDKSLDKMSYYNRAAEDSAKMKDLIKNDPYFNSRIALNNDAEETYNSDAPLSKYNDKTGLKTSPYGSAYSDPNEVKVYKKLDELNQLLADATEIKPTDHSANNSDKNASVNTPDIDRLEQMMQRMHRPESEDLEMQQLDGMLEKILDIQHPVRLQEKLKQTSENKKGVVFAVSARDENNVSLLDDSEQPVYDSSIRSVHQSNAFYSFDDLTAVSEVPNAIEAVIHETQTVVNGSTIKLRLVGDIYINGTLVSKDNFLFGIASIIGERLSIKISSIRFQHSIFPVALSVYDMDGMQGIYIPGAVTRDVAKQAGDRAFQEFGTTTLDPSLAAQAASAGIAATRNLLSKKVKLVKVTVKAGYQVLLKDEQQSD